MATAPMKSHPLHNFSLPFLKWGATTTATTHHHNRGRMPSPADASEPDNDADADNQNDSVRPHRVGSRSSRVQRLSFSSSTKAQKDESERLLKQAMGTEVEKNETEEDEEEHENEVEDVVVGKPWNLRPRKGVQEALVNAGVMESHNPSRNNVNSKPKSMRLREMVESRGCHGEKKEKIKFWLTLSREEIEEDIFVMTGSRPARRPRKRPKNIQKQVDNVFPGLWLVGLTVDAYRVTDAPMKK
ncbi:uncharacterized protein LOC123212217 [Mangifera indica]|uniref:uncharacterized protein LOC123212217 n=1 Tax=Mangifera indica TaxID=29780 RepID=UPI001CF9CD34|nr:uncharacterized protein LOC123212217 [Mangifera indica]XP_044487232.1 uncharacterized protein LOC123212217 [Mangifera indica]